MNKKYKHFIAVAKDEIKRTHFKENVFFEAENGIVYDRSQLRIKQIKKYDQYSKHLSNFENKVTRNGIRMSWAVDYVEALEQLRRIVKNYSVTTIQLKTGYLLKEIGFDFFMDYHSIAIRQDESVQMCIYQADLVVEETGSIYLESFDRAISKDLKRNVPQIFLIGLESLYSSLAEFESVDLVQTIKSRKQELMSILYTPIVENTKKGVYLIVVDNSRSNIFEQARTREMLRCVHCGACKQVCPVYQRVGEEAFDNVYTGPVASVLLPFLESKEEYAFISYACTLCGRCQKVCPMGIPLTDLILINRNILLQEKALDLYSKEKRLANFLSNRKRMNITHSSKKHWMSVPLSTDMRKNRKWKKVERKSFNQQYMERLTLNEKKNGF